MSPSGIKDPSKVTSVSAVLGKGDDFEKESNWFCQSRTTDSGGIPQVFNMVATSCRLVHGTLKTAPNFSFEMT